MFILPSSALQNIQINGNISIEHFQRTFKNFYVYIFTHNFHMFLFEYVISPFDPKKGSMQHHSILFIVSSELL